MSDCAELFPAILPNPHDERHEVIIRHSVRYFEINTGSLGGDHGSERPKAFSFFHHGVDSRLIFLWSRVSDDAAVSKCPWTELGSTLRPSENRSFCQQS